MPAVDITQADMDRARRIARRYSHDPEVESAAGEALMHAARNWDGRGTWAGYSGYIVRFRCIDAARKLTAQRKHETPLTELATEPEAVSDGPLTVLGVEITDAEAETLLNADHRTKAWRAARAAVLARLEGARP